MNQNYWYTIWWSPSCTYAYYTTFRAYIISADCRRCFSVVYNTHYYIKDLSIVYTIHVDYTLIL